MIIKSSSHMILGKMRIYLCRAGVAVIQDLSDEMQTTPSLSQPGTYSTPKIMEADILDASGFSNPSPGLINVHQMRAWLHPADHIGIVLLPRGLRKQVNDLL
jgi:hypothetical protein